MRNFSQSVPICEYEYELPEYVLTGADESKELPESRNDFLPASHLTSN